MKKNIYRLRLHRPPSTDIDLAKTKKTLLAPLGLIVYGVTMPLLLLKFYVIPYQIGTGEISPDGSVNWNTGEALISFSCLCAARSACPDGHESHLGSLQPT